jgi:membrane fusion protein (multidrug efflux system)
MFMKPIVTTGIAIAVVVLLLAGCGKAPPPPPNAPTEVMVIQAQAQSLPLTRDLVGRLSPTRSADVRARVAGVLLERLYKEGTLVKAGQPLFRIDPAPLQAELDRAAGALAAAEAEATNAHVVAERARRLVNEHVLSQADVDTAQANERSSAARVKQAQADVRTARIRVGYATVTAPIAGQAAQQQVTEGALVGENGATLLTTIDQIDPVYVNFNQPADAIEQLRREQTGGSVELLPQDQAHVELLSANGKPSGQIGKLDYSGVTVDPSTGAISYRAVVPNPDRVLLPGTFVNLRLTVGNRKNAFLVPQVALLRDNNGAYVFTIDGASKTGQKRVTAATQQGDDWVVTSGLEDGDQIIVSGLGTLRAGQAVKVKTASPSASAAASPGARKAT